MNKIFLIGRLTKEPDTRSTTNGVAVCTFTLAVDRKFKDANGNKEADFLSIVTWRKTAELCTQYLRKGSQVAVIGSLQVRTYEKDGQKRYITEIVADEVEFLSKATGANSETVGFTGDSDNPFNDLEPSDDVVPF